jgi:hypothetical protein
MSTGKVAIVSARAGGVERTSEIANSLRSHATRQGRGAASKAVDRSQMCIAMPLQLAGGGEPCAPLGRWGCSNGCGVSFSIDL